jgi:hypothetical protein
MIDPVTAPTSHAWQQRLSGALSWPDGDRTILQLDVGYWATWTARPILRHLVACADAWDITAHRHRDGGILREQGTLTVGGHPGAVDRYLRMLNRVDGLHTFPGPA